MSPPYIVNGAVIGILHIFYRSLSQLADTYLVYLAHPRLEINSLKEDEFQFSLFIQAVSKLQSAGYNPLAASWQEIGMSLSFVFTLIIDRCNDFE